MKFRLNPWRELKRTIARAREPENSRTLARVYWEVLLVGFVCLLALAWSFGLWERSNVQTILEGPGDSFNGHAPVLDKQRLDTVVAGFSARADRYQTIASQPPAIPDPSQ